VRRGFGTREWVTSNAQAPKLGKKLGIREGRRALSHEQTGAKRSPKPE